MIALAQLLVATIDELPIQGGELVVSSVDLELPIESRLGRHGRFEASWPRGRFGTGFDPPLGALVLRLTVEQASAGV